MEGVEDPLYFGQKSKAVLDAFLRNITILDSKEPCEAGPSKAQEKKHVFAVEVEDTEGMTLREIELKRRIALLERQLLDCEPESRRVVKKQKDLTLSAMVVAKRPY